MAPTVIVFDGCDFSGKSRIIEEIASQAETKGFDIITFTFPYVHHSSFARLDELHRLPILKHKDFCEEFDQLTKENLEYGITEIKKAYDQNKYDLILIERLHFYYYVSSFMRRLDHFNPNQSLEENVRSVYNTLPPLEIPFQINLIFIPLKSTNWDEDQLAYFGNNEMPYKFNQKRLEKAVAAYQAIHNILYPLTMLCYSNHLIVYLRRTPLFPEFVNDYAIRPTHQDFIMIIEEGHISVLAS
nr:hypothetical protein [Abalone asfa-like virus]